MDRVLTKISNRAYALLKSYIQNGVAQEQSTARPLGMSGWRSLVRIQSPFPNPKIMRKIIIIALALALVCCGRERIAGVVVDKEVLEGALQAIRIGNTTTFISYPDSYYLTISNDSTTKTVSVSSRIFKSVEIGDSINLE